MNLSKQASCLNSEHAREVRFVPVPFFRATLQPSDTHCAEVGFYNWNRSAFIIDGIGYGPTEDTAAARAWLDWEDDLRRPHVAEDSLGLGCFN